MKLDRILQRVAANALSKVEYVKCITPRLDTVAGNVYKVFPTNQSDLNQGLVMIKDSAGELYQYIARNFRNAT